ncbi:hypothetical protein Q1695_007919 [Nippostrongylus brasiliensis]|nr:hypothetical protein Q1695_007919 [Nippostrongylus brasiliensis]
MNRELVANTAVVLPLVILRQPREQMQYLIIGESTSVVSNLIVHLYETTAHNVVLLSNPQRQLAALQILARQCDPGRFTLVNGSPNNEQLLLQIMRNHGVDVVIDCSFVHRTSSSTVAKRAREGLHGLTNLLDAVKEYGQLKHFLLVSSQAVYGQSESLEGSPLAPETECGAALMSAEAVVHSYVVSYDLPLAIVRLSYGLINDNIEGRLVNHGDYVNLISTNDAIKDILLASNRSENAEVWNIGGDRDYVAKEALYVCGTAKEYTTVKVLLFGSKGWIGQQFSNLLREKGILYTEATTRPGVDCDNAIRDEIVRTGPSHVISMLGRTQGQGNNSIGFLEGGPDKLKLNLRDNLYAPWILASLCESMNIHFTYLGTGCLFKYNEEHGVDGPGYNEDDNANYYGTSYSAVKGITERLLRHFYLTLQCRIRLPVNNEKDDRNLVAKVMTFEKVLDIPNSITVLPDCLPILLDLSMKRTTGVVNLVNPGAICFPEISRMYREQLNSEWNYEVLSAKADSSLFASRSHCRLNTALVEMLYPNLRSARSGVMEALEKIGELEG